MTGSFINSSDIGQRKSSGTTGDWEHWSVHAWSPQWGEQSLLAETPMLLYPACTKFSNFLSSIDIFFTLSSRFSPPEPIISCRASDSCLMSLTSLNFSFLHNIHRIPGSVSSSLHWLYMDNRSSYSSKSGASIRSLHLLNWVWTSSTWK